MSAYQKYKYVNDLPVSNKIKRLIWGVVWALLFRPTPRWAMHAWRRQLLRLFGAKVGVGSKISPSCKIWAPWNLEVGDYSAIADDVDCYTMNKIRIGSKVAISQRSFLCCGSHKIDTLLRPLTTAPITIEDHAWIAAECFVHPGVVIGKGAVIGARSVVNKSVPDWVIAVGNPCKVIRKRDLNTQEEIV